MPASRCRCLEVNVDDATGEQLAHAVAALLEAGAHDAWLSPVVMKKGRPGIVVHVLCDPARVPVLRDVLRDATGSLGVRLDLGRAVAGRPVRSSRSWVDGQLIRVKVGAGRVKAEYDDVARRLGARVCRCARWRFGPRSCGATSRTGPGLPLPIRAPTTGRTMPTALRGTR